MDPLELHRQIAWCSGIDAMASSAAAALAVQGCGSVHQREFSLASGPWRRQRDSMEPSFVRRRCLSPLADIAVPQNEGFPLFRAGQPAHSHHPSRQRASRSRWSSNPPDRGCQEGVQVALTPSEAAAHTEIADRVAAKGEDLTPRVVPIDVVSHESGLR